MLFDKSKQAYYQYDEERALSRVAASSFAMEYARRIRESDPGMGIMKIWYMYRHEFRNEDDILGRDVFTDLLANEGMKVRNKVRKPRTTDSTHGLPVFPNIVKDLIPTTPNQLWVSDITYIPIWLSDEDYVFCYLSLILDAYSKEIVGWSIGDSLKATYPLEALNMALRRIEGMEHNLIHHSDRGAQYACSEYIKMLKNRDIRISMTETGEPKDNSQAERINNTMKNELLKDMVFRSIEEVRHAVAKAVDFYNNRRPHMSIDMMTPAQAALCVGEITKKWTSYREIAIRNKQENAPDRLEIPEKGLPLSTYMGSPSGLRPSVNPI